MDPMITRGNTATSGFSGFRAAASDFAEKVPSSGQMGCLLAIRSWTAISEAEEALCGLPAPR